MNKLFRKTALIIATISVLMLTMAVNAFAAGTLTIRLSTVEALPGDTVEVTVSFENNPGATILSFDIEYDQSVMTLQDIKDAGVYGDPNHNPKANKLIWENDLLREDLTYNGVVATLVFKVSESSKSGSKISLKNGEVYTVDLDEVPVDYIDGEVKLKCTHTNTENHDEVPATCKDTGTKAHKECLDCGKLLIDGEEVTEEDLVLPIDPDNHVGETEIKDEKEATCSEEGYTGDTYCKSCGAKIKSGEKIDKLPHTPSTEWSKDEKTHWHICTVCNTKIDEAEHTFDWTIVKEATEEEEGLKKGVCSECKHETEKVIPKKDHEHKYGDEWLKDDKNHWHECLCGEMSDVAAHTYDWTTIKEATEEEEGLEKGVCSVCKHETERAIPKKNHVHTMVFSPEIPATCSAVGTRAYWRCTACNKLFADENGNVEITDLTLPINPNNHLFNGNDCVNCGFHRIAFANNAPVYINEALHGIFRNGQMIPYPHMADALGMRTDGTSTWYVCDVCGHVFGMTASAVNDEPGDTAQVIDVDTPTEAGDNTEEVEGDNVSVTDNAPEKSENPKTGVALSVIPMVLALLAIAVKKH